MKHASLSGELPAGHPPAAPLIAGHPVLGNLSEFRRNRAEFLLQVARQHGGAARFRVGLFLRGLIVADPALAREVLVEKEASFAKGVGLSLFARPLLGEGLLTSEGEVHLRQRRMIAPSFLPRRIADYAAEIAACADRAAERLAAAIAADGGRQDVADEMMRFALEAVGRTLFRSDLTSDAEAIGDALTSAMEHVNAQLGALVPLPPRVPSPSNLRARRVIRGLDEVLYRVIRERRAAGADASDFLSMLLSARDEDDGGAMTDRQVRDEAMTILLAGHETTANALAWTLHLLARAPEARARLEAEVDRALQGGAPDLATLPALPYTLQVFKEAMRLRPPAYMVVRRALNDVSIGADLVRRGEAVIVNIIGMHRRAALFPDPERFDPDRFAPDAARAIDRYAYLPFGGGSRVCIGNHFALMEGHIALARLVRDLRFDLAPGHEEVGMEPLITLRPRGGMAMLISRRR